MPALPSPPCGPRRVEADGRWILNGTKVWTTHAQFAHGIVLLVRTAPVDGDRHGGLSQFLVDLPHPQVAGRPIPSLDGGAHLHEGGFVGAEGPATAVLGAAGGGGGPG